ncbi:hypothetical protein BY996DRAFT_6429470 [Phakopsora pachyrhizi]|nr:hypothetical protein BY996DRAFT_6429470 [Phakopsora pachyrhizi]
MTSLLNRSLNEVRRSRDPIKPREQSVNSKSNEQWKHDLYHPDNQSGPNNNDRSSTTQTFGRSTYLLITNLHYDVSEAELEALFSQIGKIERGPFIKFDQSGRATEGLAFISYVSENHAEEAIKAFNGALAKGQPIGVQYELSIPKWVRKILGIHSTNQSRNFRASANPDTSGLLGRIQLDRSERRTAFAPYESARSRGHRASFPPTRMPPTGPASNGKSARGSHEGYGNPTGPHRTARSTRGSRSGGSGGGLSRAGVLGSRGSGAFSGGKSAKDLDNELEAFMKTTPASKPSVNSNEDVQMS